MTMTSNMDTVISHQFILRYGIVGLSGGAIQTSVLYLWVDALHLESRYLVGAALGFCAALLVTFTLQKYWTFRNHAHTETRRQFAYYAAIAFFSAGMNILLLHMSKLILERLSLDFFDKWYLLAQALIVAGLAFASFLANYFITFRLPRAESVGR